MAAKNLQKVNGKLGLAALNEDIFDVFKMAGFTKVFSIHPTIEETVQFCAQ
jgi:anti-anti-sigma regulatory factor